MRLYFLFLASGLCEWNRCDRGFGTHIMYSMKTALRGLCGVVGFVRDISQL